MDWIADTVITEDDSDNDDEDEIRRLDAVLEEAEIEVCDTGLPKSPKCMPHYLASQCTPASSSAFLLDNKIQSQNCATSSIEISQQCHSSSAPQSTLSCHATNSPITASQSQELSKLDTLLTLNKLYEEKLRCLERILGLRLKECRSKLDELQNSNVPPDKVEIFRYINCGRPYFRDEMNYPAPENRDTIMAKSQMYDFSLIASVPGWTVRDKNHFTNVMTQISLEMRKDEFNKKINELKRLGRNKMVEREVNKLRKERDRLNSKMPFVELALPLDQEYDWDLLASKLNKRHTPHEYRCLWKLYFHPSINKGSWSTEEHAAMQALVSEYNCQNWDEVARKLNSGRTGYQCFVYYRTNMTNSSIGKKWTPEEVTYLKRLIGYYREDVYIPWGKIAAAMENRTKIQIYNKYLRIIEQRKGRFLPEEDSVILNCVERFGPNFRRMTEYLSHRSVVQIRSRYNVLCNMRVSTVWSVEDDKKLIQIMSNLDSNMTFAAATKFFPGRNRINLRSRYMTLRKWMKHNPNLDIELAPRRGARRLNHGQATENLNKAIENLKNTLNTEVTVKKDRKKITRDSDEGDIEDAIIATLVNEAMKDQEQKKMSYESIIVLPNDTVVTNKELNLTNLHKCLTFLGSTLNQGLYINSHYKDTYPQLGECSNDVSLIKVKSYSRKNTIKTIKLDKTPDVWGNYALSGRDYVLPPHYATITGCKALMSYVTAYSMYCNSVNLSVLVRRNTVLKDLLEQLLERFYILFLWPMLLSNEGPTDFRDGKLCKIDSCYVKRPNLPQAPEVTINFRSYKKFKNLDVSEDIDLSENQDQDEVQKSTTIVPDFIPDNLNESVNNF